MPRIPQSGRQVREQVANAPTLQTRQTRTAPQADFSKLADAAGDLMRIREQEKIKAEDVDLTEKKHQIRKEYLKLTHGDAESGEVGFLNMRGKEPLELQKDYEESFNKRMEEILGSTDGRSERYTQRVNSVKGEFSNKFYEKSQIHSNKEYAAHQDNVFGEAATSLIQEATINYDSADPGRNLEEIERLIYGERDAKGNFVSSGYKDQKNLSDEEAKELQLKMSSKLHDSVITRMINNGDAKTAEVYFEVVSKNKELDAPTINKLEKFVEHSSLLGDAQEQSDKIVAMGLNQTESKRMAREIEDPELRKEVERMVDNRISEERRLAEIAKEQKLEEFAVTLEEERSLQSIRKTTEWTNLNMKQREALEARERQLNKGIDPKTDFKIYDDLNQLAARDPKAFMNMSLMKHRHQLSDSDFRRFSNLRRQMKEGGDKSDQLIKGIKTKASVLSDKIKGFKWDIKDEDDKKKIEGLNRAVEERYLQKQQELGRELTIPEVQELVDDETVTVYETSWFKPDILDDDTMSFQFDYNSIPSEDIRLIRQTRPNASRAEIIKMYLEGQK